MGTFKVWQKNNWNDRSFIDVNFKSNWNSVNKFDLADDGRKEFKIELS